MTANHQHHPNPTSQYLGVIKHRRQCFTPHPVQYYSASHYNRLLKVITATTKRTANLSCC